MKKQSSILLLNLLLFLTVRAQTFQWVKQMGGIGSEQGNYIVVDISGNVYTTGYFNDIVDFDPGSSIYNLTPIDSNDIYISKLNSSGEFIWAKQLGGAGDDYAWSISIDDSGNVYTTGYFSGTADFDPSPSIYNLTSAGFADIYVSKLNTNGDFIWAKQIGGTFVDKAYSITLDDSGNVYTTGIFSLTVDFDPGSGVYNLIAPGGCSTSSDIFICKINNSGGFVWAKQMGGIGFEQGNSIAIDNLGNVYSSGFFRETADFDPGIGIYDLTSSDGYGIYICKLNSSGDFIWAKCMVGVGDAYICSMAISDSGNVYLTGSFNGTIDFDPGLNTYNLTTISVYDIFICKINSNGIFKWAKQMVGTTLWNSGKSVSIDQFENVYTTGYFWGTVDFNPGSGNYYLTTTGTDIFICKLDAIGNFIWAKQIGGMGNDYGYSIALDQLENIYTTGMFALTTDFDPGSGVYNLTNYGSSGTYDIFVHKMDNSTGINQQPDLNTAFSVYPNPAQNVLTIETDKISVKNIISIMDINGRELIHQTLKSKKIEINVSLLSSGIYFIKFTNEDKFEYGIFVKE